MLFLHARAHQVQVLNVPDLLGNVDGSEGEAAHQDQPTPRVLDALPGHAHKDAAVKEVEKLLADMLVVAVGVTDHAMRVAAHLGAKRLNTQVCR